MEAYNNLCLSCNGSCKQLAIVKVIECPKYDYNGAVLPRQPQPTTSYRELTSYEIMAMRELITTMCAKFDDEYKECGILCSRCPMLTKVYRNGKLCKYFQNAVLPLDKKLEISLADKKYQAKICSICKTHFIPTGRQAYCSDDCKYSAKKQSTAKSMRKYRQRLGGQ